MANVLSEYFSSSFSDVGRFNNLGYNGWLPILWQIRTSCGKDLTNRALLYATKSREPDVPLSDPKMQAFDDYFRRRLSEGESVVDDTSFSGLACINQIINSRKVNH